MSAPSGPALAIQPAAHVSPSARRGRLRDLINELRHDLAGMSEFELSARMGPPNLRRRDGTAEIWQYQGQECVLHVFLYRPQSEPIVRVRFWAVSDRRITTNSHASECATAPKATDQKSL